MYSEPGYVWSKTLWNKFGINAKSWLILNSYNSYSYFSYQIFFLQVGHTCKLNHTCSGKADELETICDFDAYMPVP